MKYEKTTLMAGIAARCPLFAGSGLASAQEGSQSHATQQFVQDGMASRARMPRRPRVSMSKQGQRAEEGNRTTKGEKSMSGENILSCEIE